MRALSTAAALLLAFGPGAATGRAQLDSDVVAYRAAAIHTASMPERIENAYLVVRGGKIVEITTTAPLQARIVDLGAAVIAPGFVAADSAISSAGFGRAPSAAGAPESDGAEMRAIDGFDLFADQESLLREGITTVYSAPGRNRLIGGRGAVVKLAGSSKDHRVLRGEADLYVNLTAEVLDTPAIFDPPVPPTADDPLLPAAPQPPRSTPGIALELRRLFAAAEQYRAARATTGPSRPPFDDSLEVLGGVGQLDVRLVANTAAELVRALRLQKELFPIAQRRVLIAGGAESKKILDVLAGAGMPVILEVESFLGRIAPEISGRAASPDRDPRTAAALEGAGVVYALVPADGTPLAHLRLLAGQSRSGGVNDARALQSITANAARILGVDARVGSLRPGCDADFVVLSGAPFDLGSQVLHTFVDGQQVWSRGDRTESAGEAVVLRAGRILDGLGHEMRDAEILVVDGRIVEIGSRVGRPGGVRVEDFGPDAVLTPGFLDGFSQFGFAADRNTYSPGNDLATLRDPHADGGAELALHGITTVLSGPARNSPKGTPIGAFKTYIPRHEDNLEFAVQALASIRFEVKGENRDRNLESLSSTLKRGRDYVEKWAEYEKAHAEWEAKKAAEGEQPAAEAAAAPKAEEKKPEEGKEEKKAEEAKEEANGAAPDALSGIWTGTVQNVPEVGELTVQLDLELDGQTVSGVIRPKSDRMLPIFFSDGSFDGKTFRLEFRVEGTEVILEAEVADDALKGTIEAPNGRLMPIEAKRIVKAEARIRQVYRARPQEAERKPEKGEPQPPKLDEDLEPFKRIFAGEMPLIVDCDRRDEIAKTLALACGSYKVRLILLAPSEYQHAEAALSQYHPGVLVGLPVVREEKGRTVMPIADLGRMGLRVAFQSGSSNGGRSLRDVATWAVHHGLSPSEALRALTSGTAAMYGLEEKVGTLRAGRDGDVLVFDGEPFELGTELRAVFVRGRRVSKSPPRWQ